MKKILYTVLLILVIVLQGKAQNMAKFTEINAGVNEMGAATANVPIDCPSGRNGIEPNLSIAFNSNVPNGILGKGFMLTGISSISRGGNNFHTDNNVQSGITHTSQDNFFLDGNKLILVSGTYGVTGSLYRTENDMFARITFTGSSFLVETKEGGLLKYTVQFKLYGINTPLAYYLAYSYDKYGNYIQYDYFNEDGQIHLDQVLYNGFDGSLGGYRTGNTTPSISPNLTVKLNYININNNLDKFTDGGTKFSNKRLQTIAIKRGTTVLNTYTFLFSSTNKNEKLNGISQTNKEAVNFTWSGNETNQKVNGQLYTQMDNFKTVGDFNGDGKTDLLTVNGILNLIETNPLDPGDPNNPWLYQFNTLLNKDNFLSILTTGSDNKFASQPLIIKQLPYDNIANISIIDFDADGKDDIIFQIADITSNSTTFSANYKYKIFKMVLNEQLQIVDLIPFKKQLPESNFTYTALPDDIFRANLVTPYFIDMDGDGLPDLVQKATNVLTNSTSLQFYFSTDNYEVLRTLGNSYSLNNLNAFLPMDFNGNGKKDIFISTTSSGFYNNVKNGIIEYDYASRSFIAPTDLIANPADLSSFRSGDFNGDGNTDIIYQSLQYNGILAKIAYSNGKDAYIDDYVKKQGLYYSYWGGTDIQIVDFNNDGLDDIMERNDLSSVNTCLVNFSTGYNEFVEGTSYTSRNTTQNPSRFGNYFVGDYDADGKKDLLMIESASNNNGFSNYVLEYHKTNSSDLTQIVQPKKTYQFTYDALTHYSGYKRSFKPNVLNNCIGLNIPIKIVTNLNIVTSNSETEYYTYQYKDLVYNRHGKGFMGFMETCKTSQKANNSNPLRIQINKYVQGNTLAHELNLSTVLNYNSGSVDDLTNTITPTNLIGERNYEYRTLRTCNVNGINFSFVSNATEINYITKNVKRTCYDYDINGNLILNTAINYKLGSTDILYSNATNYTYSQFDTWLPASVITADNYKKRKNQTSIHTPIVYVYQPNSSILKTVTKYGVEEYFEFDAYGNRTRKGFNYLQNLTGGYTKNTFIQYDAAHHFIDYIQNDAGHQTVYVYDKDKEKLLSETAANGLVTTYEYDTWGRLTKTIQPNGNYSATNYDLNDNSGNYKVEEYNNLGNRATKTYNWKMMLLKEEKNTKFDAENPEKMATKNYIYNTDGLLLTETNWYDAGTSSGLLNTNYAYDSYNRLLTVSLNNQVLKSYTYNDHEVVYTEGECAPKTTLFDALNMPISVAEGGSVITYTYNSNNLPMAINTNGNTITYEYNDNGTLTQQCDPNSGCTIMEYTAINELVKTTDAKGSIYTYTYDNLGKLTQKTGINNTVYSYEYYEINLQPDLGLPKTQTLTENGVVKNKIEYAYNELAELVETKELAANNLTYTTTYNYVDDELGKHRLNSINYPNIELIYEYDNNNNLQIIGDGNQAFIWKNEDEAIDGRPLLITYGNNFKTEYTYDTYLNLAGIKSNHVNTPNNIAMHAGYTFDLVSKNLMRKDDIKNGNYETFEYDNLDRLTKSTVFLPDQTPVDFEVNYDNNGNITQKADAGASNYSGAKPHAVQNNVFSNSLSPVIIPATFAEPQEITYTQSNKIATLTQDIKDLTITYGFNEQRIHTEIKEDGVTTTEIFYISSANMEIVNGAEITYLYANGQPFAYHKKTGSNESINYLHLDYQGSIMAITTQSGTLKAAYNYDAWGRARDPQELYYTTLNPFGSGNDIRRGYTFHEHLEEFNLINMNGRVYDPLLARFLNADPLIQDNTDAQNYNRYSYVLNNPTKYTDPSGYAYTNFDLITGGLTRMYQETNRSLQMEAMKDFEGLRNFARSFEATGGGGGSYEPSIDIPDDDGYPRPLTAFEKAAFVAIFGGKAPNSEFVVTSGVYGASKWSASSTGAMQARNGDASPYYQNQAKYTGANSGGGQNTQLGLDGWEHAMGPILGYLGDNIIATRGKFQGATPGTSIASKRLSNVFPQKFTKVLGEKVGTKVAKTIGTNTIGRALGRFVPVLGWGLTMYDAGTFLYNNREEIQQGMQARDNYIQEGLMPLR
ncbi:MAG: RHS repeat-associated core domain-containing protein [Bacteroidota bacterium]